MTFDSWLKGYPPQLKIEPGNSESQKYGRLWEREEYRNTAPGEFYSQWFLAQAKPNAGAHVIDFGCGTGRGGAMLATLGHLKVTMIDFARNCLDENVRAALNDDFVFIKADLEKPIPVCAEYGFSSDVMEHIPPDKVDMVLNNILQAAQNCWFSICNVEDQCGDLIGETLHLSVHPFEWWKEKFEKRDCKIMYSMDQTGVYSHFYVSAWQQAKDIVEHGSLNTEVEQIIHNVRHNIAQGWQQATPHETNETECMILGGGPSLNDFADEIKQNRADGIKLITMNGSYNWALAHGLTPSAQIVVDARDFNARFTKPVLNPVWKIQSTMYSPLNPPRYVLANEGQCYQNTADLTFESKAAAQEVLNSLDLPHFEYEPVELYAGCKYLIASQVDPAVLEGLPQERTYLWHTMAEQIQEVLDAQYGANQWWGIPGGSTVLLRAIPLLRTLGFHKFILYGCDSCVRPGAHHGYDQPENNAPYVLPVIVKPGGKMFYCHASMVSQAEEFISMIRFIGEEIDLDVKGDGLLAHIIEVGAQQAEIIKNE